MNKREFLRLSGIIGAGIAVSPLIACNTTEGIASGTSTPAPSSGPIEFTLPQLGYEYSALAPAIDAMTMEIHHGKHHAAYVKNLNAAIVQNPAFSGLSLEQILENVNTKDAAIRNNAGGHYNHNLYWKIIAPGGGNTPEGKLAEVLGQTFGSFENFVAEFSKAANTRFGSGWAWLSVNAEKKLFVSSTPNQDNPLMTNLAEQKGIPVLGVDVWEHAYYLNYQNRRADYVSAFMSIINWNNVAANYAAAIL